jgi:SOS-response transcriptional repressor LexA
MLKPREQQALRYIRIAQAQSGVMPSYDQIGAAIGLRSRASVHDVIKTLITQRCLERPPGRRQPAKILFDPDAAIEPRPAIPVPGGSFTPSGACITRYAAELASARYGIERQDTLVLAIDGDAYGGSLSVIDANGRRSGLRRLIESPQGLHLDGTDDAGPVPFDPTIHRITGRVIGLIRAL